MTEEKRLPRILQLRAERVLNLPLDAVYQTSAFGVVKAVYEEKGKEKTVYVNLDTRERLTDGEVEKLLSVTPDRQTSLLPVVEVDDYNDITKKTGGRTVELKSKAKVPKFDTLITRDDVNLETVKPAKKTKAKKTKTANAKKSK